jgi:ribosomal biogenesis protein LAS1
MYLDDSFSPSTMSLLLWTPLLEHLQSHHPDLRSALSNRIISRLLEEPVPVGRLTPEPAHTDPSFDMCIARWAWWMIESWNVDDDATTDLKRDVVSTLVIALGPGGHRTRSDKKA